jgi:enoyl-CoA hydratase
VTVLLVEVTGPTAVVTLNRPEARNALNPELTAAIKTTIASLDATGDLAAIILTGADPAFCAGVDLKHLASAPPSGDRLDDTAFEPLPPHRTPVVGAINGAAVTGGLELALACDFLIASERATFADTHARVGVMPGGGMTVRLPSFVGANRARQMSFTGDFIDARRALEWGLVNEVVPHDQLLPRARAVAGAMASVPVGNVREVRALYAAVEGLTGDAAWARQRDLARAWMQDRFDQARLASQREAIVQRGSNQQEGRWTG